jgi:hypothetical protein
MANPHDSLRALQDSILVKPQEYLPLPSQFLDLAGWSLSLLRNGLLVSISEVDWIVSSMTSVPVSFSAKAPENGKEQLHKIVAQSCGLAWLGPRCVTFRAR